MPNIPLLDCTLGDQYFKISPPHRGFEYLSIHPFSNCTSRPSSCVEHFPRSAFDIRSVRNRLRPCNSSRSTAVFTKRRYRASRRNPCDSAKHDQSSACPRRSKEVRLRVFVYWGSPYVRTRLPSLPQAIWRTNLWLGRLTNCNIPSSSTGTRKTLQGLEQRLVAHYGAKGFSAPNSDCRTYATRESADYQTHTDP